VDLTAVVWIFLNHGREDQLVMDQEPMSVDGFKGLFDPLKRVRPEKDVLVVIDACRSGRFARAVMNVLECERVRILTSSPQVCMTTLVILTKDDQLKDLIRGPFLIQGSGFTMELHNAIAYKEGNPLLSELPGLLNFGDCEYDVRGFHAEYFEKVEGQKHLREFFGGTVGPDARVPIRGEDFRMDLILPLVLHGRIFDDFIKSGVRTDPIGSVQAFVEIRLDSAGKIEIVKTGPLNPLDAWHSEVLEQLSPRIGGQDTVTKAPSRTVRAMDVVFHIFKEWKINGRLMIDGCYQEPRNLGQLQPRKRSEIWEEIQGIFDALQRLGPGELEGVTTLALIWEYYPKELWTRKIREVREALLPE
jgi:hypothetical protein